MARVVTFVMKVRNYGSRFGPASGSCPDIEVSHSPHQASAASPWGAPRGCNGDMSSPTRRRRPVTLAAVAAFLALLSITPAHAATTVVCASPVAPFSVSRLVSLPAQNWLPGHRGIDLATTVGGTVTSPAAGEVTFAGVVVNRPVVSVRHAGGLVSSLEPVDPTVRVGDVVGVGDALGTVSIAAGHCAPAACLHWGLRRDGRYVNPLDYLRGFGQVRLLPVDG